ncbi:hypothetical protein [Streptomyces sp. NBRC 110035]|uniref:hypothetical protein n=1 Tax=Streptomyces sp. NBRC 110035 TaxID=1547867 RepID=UPI00131E7191|nr:hypothetical protein [Streptomyces sp. NBRC 110035]
MLEVLTCSAQLWKHPAMSWQMALEYLRTLVWPAVVLTLGFTFRKQLASLFGRVESVETPLGTVAFEKQADAVAQEAAEIGSEMASELAAAETAHPAIEDTEKPEIPSEEPQQITRPQYSGSDLSDLFELAETETTAAVMAAWREVERALKAAGTKHGVARISPQTLSNMGLLSDELARSVEDLRHLRNRVAHEGDILLTKSGARSYITAAQRIVEALELSQDPRFQALQYERSVVDALGRAGLPAEPGYRDDEFDAYGQTPAGTSIATEIRFRRRGVLRMRDIEKVVSKLPSLASNVLIVTNAPLSEDVREFNRTYDSRPLCEVVQWQGDEDTHLLARAIGRLAG